MKTLYNNNSLGFFFRQNTTINILNIVNAFTKTYSKNEFNFFFAIEYVRSITQLNLILRPLLSGRSYAYKQIHIYPDL